MSFEVLSQRTPTYSRAATVAVVALSVLLVVLAVTFAWLLLTGKGSDYVLGTLLAFEFLIAGVEVVVYSRYFIFFREVREDREEELLW